MKKVIILLLVLSAMLFSCQSNSLSAKDLSTKIISMCAVPYAKKYEFFAKEYSDLRLSKNLSMILYDCDLYEYCSDFSIAISKKDLVSELHVLIAQSRDKADYLKKRLEYRANVLRDKELYLYDTENAESINAMIYQKDLYVFLAIGPSSEIMYEKISELMK